MSSDKGVETRTEYGVEFYDKSDPEVKDSFFSIGRESARASVQFINNAGKCSAKLIRRTVTYGAWEVDPDE